MTMTDDEVQFCAKCGRQRSAPDAAFCDGCGSRLGGPAQPDAMGQVAPRVDVRTEGGDFSAEQIVVSGRDTHIHRAQPEQPVANYEARWSWKSPLTQAVLGWIGTALGVVGLFAGYQTVQPAVQGLGGALSPSAPDAAPLSDGPSAWVFVLLGAIGLSAVVWGLFRVAKHETLHVGWSWLPALTGWGHRIGLARLRGDCPLCGAKLRFGSRPTEWIEFTDGRRKTTATDMFATCVRDPEHHFWRLDRTDAGARG